MSELKLEVGKKYIVELNPINGNQFLHSNYNDCVLEFVRRFNKGVLLFDNNGEFVILNDNDFIYKEYTEPKKLSGWVNVYKDHVETHVYIKKMDADNCCMKNRLACIDLSQFNEGEGL